MRDPDPRTQEGRTGPYRFAGKVALVTGAGGGIGAATAIELAREGASVLIVDIDGENAEAVARRIREAGGAAASFRADVSKPESHDAMLAEVRQRFGALHHAVNNAGIPGAFGPLPDISAADWQRVVDVNLNSLFFGMKHQLPAIEAAGGGSIVNIASVYAHLAMQRLDAYTATKHAVLGITRSAALEYATRGVRVNAVSPGPILTPLTSRHPEETARAAARVAMKRMGQPEEVAKAILFLLSEDASYITGTEILVDGGRTLE